MLRSWMLLPGMGETARGLPPGGMFVRSGGISRMPPRSAVRIRWGKSSRIDGGCTICWGTCGSGWPIRPPGASGGFAAGVGAAAPTGAGRRIAKARSRAIAAAFSAFARRETPNPVHFYFFTLCGRQLSRRARSPWTPKTPARRSLRAHAVLGKGHFPTQPGDGPGRGAERGMCV